MKRILSMLLLIFLVNTVSMHAQYEYNEEDFETAEGYAKYKQYQEFFKERDNTYSKQLGIVEYKGLRYEDCRAIAFTYDNFVHIQISQPEKEYFTPFYLNIGLKLADGQLPTGNFSFPDKQTLENDLHFIWNYEDWRLASHTLQAKQASIHIQPFGKSYYNISGSMELDVEEKNVVDFMFWGPLSHEDNEVKRIFHFNPKDYFYNQGQLTIGEKIVSIPVGFRDWLPNSQKIYLLDRLIAQDSKLEYGVYFEFPLGEFPIGTFKADEFSQPFSAAFFNKNKTEYPSETELNIKWDKKKKRYDITYSMNFLDGRTIKGSYTGQVPESTF